MRHTVVLEQDQDGGYVACVPALQECISQGDSRAEALANIRRPKRQVARDEAAN